jgi:hypothetical protein
MGVDEHNVMRIKISLRRTTAGMFVIFFVARTILLPAKKIEGSKKFPPSLNVALIISILHLVANMLLKYFRSNFVITNAVPFKFTTLYCNKLQNALAKSYHCRNSDKQLRIILIGAPVHISAV